jgi:hypothetical protein
MLSDTAKDALTYIRYYIASIIRALQPTRAPSTP